MPDRQLKLLFSRNQIDAEVKRLAATITADFSGRDLLVIAVLKGSFLFVADLVRGIDLPLNVDFVRLASYGSDTRSSGIVEIRMESDLPIRGRNVVVVEDIVDSGFTLETLYHQLLQRQPKSLKICTLIDKTARREVPIRPDYVGFTINDGFIVGYGLDFDEHYRNLPDIHLLEEA